MGQDLTRADVIEKPGASGQGRRGGFAGVGEHRKSQKENGEAKREDSFHRAFFVFRELVQEGCANYTPGGLTPRDAKRFSV